MSKQKSMPDADVLFYLIVWGALWGIFEATAGAVIHLLPLPVGWLVWYPVACFFMANVYCKTRKVFSVMLVGMLSAAIKMLNLLLPMSVDRVINPAVSIVFEALTLSLALFILNRTGASKRNPLIMAGAALGMNTAWRLLYLLYLLFAAPEWIREISVLATTEQLLTFLVIHNLVTSAVLAGGALLLPHMLKPVRWIESKLSAPALQRVYIKVGLAVVLIGTNIALQLLI